MLLLLSFFLCCVLICRCRPSKATAPRKRVTGVPRSLLNYRINCCSLAGLAAAGVRVGVCHACFTMTELTSKRSVRVCVVVPRVAMRAPSNCNAGHPNYLTPSEIQVAYSLSALAASGPHGRPSSALLTAFADRVLSKHPLVFGVDSPSRRRQWAAELRWAWTIVNTRCYSARAGGTLRV